MVAYGELEFWYEFASTYSYPTALTIESRAAEAGVRLVWRPFLLGPIFAAQGWADSPFNLYPAKGAYMWRDLERVCGEAGLAWRPPSTFPRNSVLAARVALVGCEQGWCPAFSRAVYRANFVDDRDIADRGVIAEILAGLNLDADAIFAQIQAPSQKAVLRSRTDRAVSLGIFGAPSFTIGGELFWGGDRLDQALAWARSAGAPATVS
jgi:2-hydroxychromene-2-carboxylate isomerase